MNWVLILAVVQVMLLVIVIKRLGENGKLMIKVSEIKLAVAEAKKNNKEAFTEIGNKIADLNQQIADLIAGVGDPTVSDEQFEADLRDLGTDAKALAEIVPGSPSTESPV